MITDYFDCVFASHQTSVPLVDIYAGANVWYMHGIHPLNAHGTTNAQIFLITIIDWTLVHYVWCAGTANRIRSNNAQTINWIRIQSVMIEFAYCEAAFSGDAVRLIPGAPTKGRHVSEVFVVNAVMESIPLPLKTERTDQICIINRQVALSTTDLHTLNGHQSIHKLEP